MKVTKIALRFCFCGTELAELENRLTRQSGVRAASIDRTRSVAHVEYDAAATGPDQLEKLLRDSGYGCECADCPASCCQPGHPAAGQVDDVAEHQHHPSHQAAPAHEDHTAMGHDEHRGHDEHAGHGADMVNAMLRKFVVSAILTLPIVVFSPIGHAIGLPSEPPFGIPMSWFGFALATPVVWWGGWPFISSAWRSLRHGLTRRLGASPQR